LPPPALYWDTNEPYNYLRVAGSPDDPVVLVGGRDAKTGTADERAAFGALESYARERFGVERVVARWAAQLYDPADHLPFIGKSPLAEHVYVATGFSGDGLPLGALAAAMLAHQVLGETTPYDKLFRPARLRLGGVKAFVQDQLHVAKHFLGDRLPRFAESKVAQLAAGEGCVDAFGGAKVAAYRTPAGELRTFSAVCPHLRCLVHWNARESTFDCPCHGSRFDTAGRPLEGPALEGLTEVELDFELTRVATAASGAVHRDDRQATGNEADARL
jgi:nitrite reductase/ring-hydroxylating ferredoxin subunit